jgi:hypothetical protein
MGNKGRFPRPLPPSDPLAMRAMQHDENMSRSKWMMRPAHLGPSHLLLEDGFQMAAQMRRRLEILHVRAAQARLAKQYLPCAMSHAR